MAEEMLPYEAPPAGSAPAPQGQVPAAGATPQGSGQPQPNVNLDAFPQFQAWKSKMDTQLDEANKRAQAAETRAMAIESDMKRWQMEGMDEPTRLAYERDEANKRAFLASNEVARLKYEGQVRKDNEEIAARLSIPVRELETIVTPDDDPHVRWSKAFDYAQRRATFLQGQGVQVPNPQAAPPFPQQGQYQQMPWQQTPQQQTPQGDWRFPQAPPLPPAYNPATNPANNVDTGSGYSGSLDRYNSAFRTAYENNDVVAMLDIQERAGRAGVAIVPISQ